MGLLCCENRQSVCAMPTAPAEADGPTNDKAKDTPSRKFQQAWLNESKYKNWLTYDLGPNKMYCKLCMSAGKTNAFVHGCGNFRTSALEEHMKTDDHATAILIPCLQKDIDRLNTTCSIQTEKSY